MPLPVPCRMQKRVKGCWFGAPMGSEAESARISQRLGHGSRLKTQVSTAMKHRCAALALCGHPVC